MAPLDSSVWVAWGDHLVPMQKPSGMRAGQEERHAVYLMVFHEHRPTFGEWDIRYYFAKEAASGKEPAAGASRMPVSGGATSTAPAGSESQENLFWQSIMNSTTTADFEAYLRQFPNGIFRVLAQNRLAALRGSAGDPPVTAGATAAPAARRVESRVPQPPRQAEQGRTSGISAGQTCAGKPKGAKCWMELANQPECYVWNDYLAADETAAWPGECSGGMAQGMGTLTWVWGRGKKHKREDTGRLQDGKQHGRWVLRPRAGRVPWPTSRLVKLLVPGCHRPLHPVRVRRRVDQIPPATADHALDPLHVFVGRVESDVDLRDRLPGDVDHFHGPALLFIGDPRRRQIHQ